MPPKRRNPSGNRPRLDRLRDLADRLETEIEHPDSSSALAALGRTLMTALEQIDKLAPAQPKGTPLDELQKRRAARSASPKVAPRTRRAVDRG